MKKILGIEIPADLSELDNDALKALAASLRTAAQTALQGEVDVAKLDEIKEAKSFRDTVLSTLSEREAADAELAAEREALLAELEGDDADGEDTESNASSDDAEADDESDDADGDDESDDAEAEADNESVTASTKPYRPKVKALAKGTGSDTPPPATETVSTNRFKAVSKIDSMEVGQEFADAAEIGAALLQGWKDSAGGNSGKVRVARQHGTFKESQLLSKDPKANVEKFGGTDPWAFDQDAITAAVCAPRENIYNSVNAVTSLVTRPVKRSLANYRPERGGVSVYPTPVLADLDEAGTGIWTRDDDADPEAVKEACAVITCANPVNYDVYGIYRCMTIKNMMALTFPELVAAYLNRLEALQARMAEVALLDGMYASPNVKHVLATGTGFGASIDLFSTIINGLSIYREEERLGDQPFDGWAPRALLRALQIDVLRMRRTSGNFRDRFVSEATINAMLRDEVGVEMTWTLDRASAWDPAPVVDDGDTLPDTPVTIDFLVTPRGNLRALDRGMQDIGFQNNIVRDLDGTMRNQFTPFYESWEGIMDFGAPSWAFTIEDVCFGGAQTADVTAIDCPASSGS